MSPDILHGIVNHLHADTRQKILWVADEPPARAEIPSSLECVFCPPDTAKLAHSASGKFDYAIVQDLPGAMDKIKAEALLARLRDVNAQRVFWVVGRDTPWHANEVIALGFRRLQNDESFTLYGFDIENYKTTPDWLNPKHWAHPERWDKERW